MTCTVTVGTVAVIGKENEPDFDPMREENVMSPSTTVVGALSLILMSASGMADAVAHPHVSYVWTAANQKIELAAENIQLERPADAQKAATKKCQRLRCKRQQSVPPH